MRTLFRLLLRLFFGFDVHNAEILRTPGPVLLIPNHVSWLDFLFLWACLELDWRFVVSNAVAHYSWLHRLIMLNRRTFPVDTASPYAARHLAEHLRHQGRLVLFAEGQISRTGSLMKLYEGTGFLLHKTRAKVIAAYLRGAQRLRWSRQPGWRRWWPRVSLHFTGLLQPPPTEGLSTSQARQRLTAWMRDQMIRHQYETEMTFGPPTVLHAIVESARPEPNKVILQDATMQALTYRRLLAGADLLGNRLAARLSAGADPVGVLLPNVNAMPLVLLGLWAHGRVPAILNFSTGPATMLACAQLSGLRQIITSRLFLTRAKLKIEPLAQAGLEFVYLEDLREGISSLARLQALLRTLVCRHALTRRARGAEDTGVLLFTSGSEGVPKGVELTHRNLLANVRQMLAVIDITDHDRVFNALPTFHSFGLTVGTLLGLVRGLSVFLYPSPLHYRLVPAALYDRHCTIFLATNTFLNGYARKAHPFDFRSVRYLFAGAEKIQEDTARVWAQRFGLRILEGYGATECSPVISVNLPQAPCHGSAGRLMPGMECRLEPVEGVANAGRLLVRGPNIMRGYLNPEPNARFKALGGWYDTGDIVSIDNDGFLFIRGRLKRFAKISGEMVSLTAVEDALAGAFPHYGQRCEVAVVARPDPDKGEALIAVTNEPRLALDELRAVLKTRGFTNLCVPREICALKTIPKLGTGKVNHRELAAMLVAANPPG